MILKFEFKSGIEEFKTQAAICEIWPETKPKLDSMAIQFEAVAIDLRPVIVQHRVQLLILSQYRVQQLSQIIGTSRPIIERVDALILP